jgi:uncharacterized phage protein gp47/JayE
MKSATTLTAVVFCCSLFLGLAPKSSVNRQTSLCSDAREAITDADGIRAGMTRREIEKRFRRDGGLQFPRTTRYLYPDCDYIKIEISFEPVTSHGGDMFSGDDKVVKVSKPYLDYPVAD